MIAHTIIAAQESSCFQNIVVTTECDEIKAICKEWDVIIIDRPEDLATDTSSSCDVIYHTLEVLKDKNIGTSHFALLQPTSPLRNSQHIKEAITKLEASQCDTLVSMTEFEHPYQKGLKINHDNLEPITQWEDLTKPRQHLEKSYYTNGAIYLSRSKDFLKSKNLFYGKTQSYIMDKRSSIDIDQYFDLELANFLLNH